MCCFGDDESERCLGVVMKNINIKPSRQIYYDLQQMILVPSFFLLTNMKLGGLRSTAYNVNIV